MRIVLRPDEQNAGQLLKVVQLVHGDDLFPGQLAAFASSSNAIHPYHIPGSFDVSTVRAVFVLDDGWEKPEPFQVSTLLFWQSESDKRDVGIVSGKLQELLEEEKVRQGALHPESVW